MVTGVILTVALFILVFSFSGEKGKLKRRRGKAVKEIEAPKKDWEETAMRLEKRVQSLKGEAALSQKREKDLEYQITVEKVKVKKLQEKLSQEREWHQKEQAVLDNKGKEFARVKEELNKSQEAFSREHMENLRQKAGIQELKEQIESLNGQRRAAEAESAHLKARLEIQRREMAQLKAEYMELKKKKEDTVWVVKSDYERIERLLREKEKEIERIQRESKP
jgi:chromosome segregation ATPase